MKGTPQKMSKPMKHRDHQTKRDAGFREAVRWLFCLLFLAAPLSAQNTIGYASGQDCTVSADVVTCGAEAGTGSLVVTAAETAFADLQNSLTPGWTGTLVCQACDVANGFPSCTAVGDEVTTSRKKAALSRLTCVLRSLIKQREAQEQTPFVPAEPVIGGGDPG